MDHWPYWLAFFVASLASIVLAKVLDDRARRLKRTARESQANT